MLWGSAKRNIGSINGRPCRGGSVTKHTFRSFPKAADISFLRHLTHGPAEQILPAHHLNAVSNLFSKLNVPCSR